MDIVTGSTPTIGFIIVDATDRATAEPGLAPTVYLSKNGAAFAESTNAAEAVSGRDGWYKVALTATETNTPGQLLFEAIAVGGAVWRDIHQVYTTVPVVLADGETVELAAAQFAKIADNVWRRHTDSIEGSSDGDTLQFESPLGMVAKFVHDIARSAGTLYIKKSDGTTLGTQTATYDPEGQPISALTTD